MKSILSKITSPIAKKTKLTLEYFIILQKSGLPIYSKCWGTFCSVLSVDDALLSGFLSAITTMPQMLIQSTNLNAVEMGFSKLLFNYTTPTGKIIIGGFRREEITNKSMKKINDFFVQLSNFLENDYKDTSWDFLTDDEKIDFEKDLLNKIILPWFHAVQSEMHNDNEWPLCTNGNLYKGTSQSNLKDTYVNRLRMIFNGFKKFVNNYPNHERVVHAKKIREEVNKRANIDV